MDLEAELEKFDADNHLIKRMVSEAKIEPSYIDSRSMFLAEALVFKTYRTIERLIRAFFLNSCASEKTMSGNDIQSKLRCTDWSTAEDILKSGNKFLDWGTLKTQEIWPI
ncbi:MAG: hypothetical protein ACRYFE_07855 [Janthinobacterium lividum]